MWNTLNLFQVYKIKIAQSYSIDPLLLEIIYSSDIIEYESSEIIVNFFPLILLSLKVGGDLYCFPSKPPPQQNNPSKPPEKQKEKTLWKIKTLEKWKQ